MSELDAGFMEVLASCADAEGEVDYTDDGWKPADGDYTVLLERFRTGSVDKDGIMCGTANAVFRIMTGDFSGKTFGEFFWLPSSVRKTGMGMSNLLRLARCLSGRDFLIAEIAEAASIIGGNVGTALLNVRVVTTTSAKTNKNYTNTKFLALVDEPVDVTG